MNLSVEPELVQWPEMHYVFVEKVGPFMQNAGQAWQSAHKLSGELTKNNQIIGYMSLYKVGPKVYRAGFALAAEPVNLPDGLSYEKFPGGQYSKFVLKGSYMQLPQASGQVWSMTEEKGIPVRDDFAIENYKNDPKTTPEEELVTEILIPTK